MLHAPIIIEYTCLYEMRDGTWRFANPGWAVTRMASRVLSLQAPADAADLAERERKWRRRLRYAPRSRRKEYASS